MKDDGHQLQETGPGGRPRTDMGDSMSDDDGLLVTFCVYLFFLYFKCVLQRPSVVTESEGVVRITVRKTDQKLGIALEGGADTKHPLPRIINVHVRFQFLRYFKFL